MLPARLMHFDGLIGLIAEQLVHEIEQASNTNASAPVTAPNPRVDRNVDPHFPAVNLHQQQ